MCADRRKHKQHSTLESGCSLCSDRFAIHKRYVAVVHTPTRLTFSHPGHWRYVRSRPTLIKGGDSAEKLVIIPLAVGSFVDLEFGFETKLKTTSYNIKHVPT